MSLKIKIDKKLLLQRHKRVQKKRRKGVVKYISEQ